MFGNRGSSDASTEGKAPKRRRDGRGLGPFTGGQLTIIIVTLAVVMGFPLAAFAVTGSNVFVTDATSGTHAKVDSGGHVLVGDGAGPLTVDGTINARAALPTKPIVITPKTAPTTLATIYGPVNTPFAIGSLTLTNFCGSPGSAQFFELDSSVAPGGDAVIAYNYVPAISTVHVTFPIPLVTTLPPGGTASLKAKSDGCVHVTGVGYQS